MRISAHLILCVRIRYEVEVVVGMVSYMLNKGHRLRLTVTSSLAPYYSVRRRRSAVLMAVVQGLAWYCGLQNNRPKDDKKIPENLFRGRKGAEKTVESSFCARKTRRKIFLLGLSAGKSVFLPSGCCSAIRSNRGSQQQQNRLPCMCL